MEKEIQQADMTTHIVAQDVGQLATIAEELLSLQSAKSEESLKQENAVASLRNYKTLKGLHTWKPTDLTEDHLRFVFLGLCPRSCLGIEFRIAQQGVTCKASVEPSIFSGGGDRNFAARLKKAHQFIDQQMTKLCEGINETQLTSPTDVGAILRLVSVQLGRVDCTASELVTLQRRYGAKITTSATCFQLLVEFVGLSGASKVLASFELSSKYPFSPLNVSLDPLQGDFDMLRAQKHLIRNAKPGFGYLSRTCDVLAACTT
jgi:hypothetical protein